MVNIIGIFAVLKSVNLNQTFGIGEMLLAEFHSDAYSWIDSA